MVAVYPGQILNQSHLDGYFTLSDGSPVDPDTVTVEIEDHSVVPNVTVFGPVTPTKFGTGAYYAPWTVPVSANLGTYKAIWKWKLTPTTDERTGCEEFEVKDPSEFNPDSSYITPDDFYAEGFSEIDFPRDFIQDRIDMVQGWIEMITGHFFESRDLVLCLDGCIYPRQTWLLRVPHPIIEIDEIAFAMDNQDNWEIQALNDFAIYNKIYPDDNFNPKIVIKSGSSDNIFSSFRLLNGCFPGGTQNIRLTGKFGWVDPKTGVTPAPVKMAMMLLLKQYIYEISSPQFQAALKTSGLVWQQTDGHSYRIAERMGMASLTGVPEVDSILTYYVSGGSALAV